MFIDAEDNFGNYMTYLALGFAVSLCACLICLCLWWKFGQGEEAQATTRPAAVAARRGSRVP